jgi:hypothetical protein
MGLGITAIGFCDLSQAALCFCSASIRKHLLYPRYDNRYSNDNDTDYNDQVNHGTCFLLLDSFQALYHQPFLLHWSQILILVFLKGEELWKRQ